MTGAPVAEALADFWSPGLSQARLRALPPSPVTPPDLLLKIADPPDLQVRGIDLRDLLASAYGRLPRRRRAEKTRNKRVVNRSRLACNR